MPVLSRRIQQIVPAGKDGWELHFEALARKQAGGEIVMMTAGDHDFDTPSQTVEACMAALREGHHHYIQLGGLPRLRQVMATVSSRVTGVSTSADEVIVTPGGQGALYAAAQATLDPGSRAIVIAPYYATYPGTIRAAGAEVDVVEASAENGFQPKRGDIEAAIGPHTRAIFVNSPNNPTGAIYSAETLDMLAALCREHDLWLISDEVYWSMTDGRHRSPRSRAGMKERTLVVNSMSKSHGMTGWRIGWLTGPETLIRTLVGLNLVSTYGLPDFTSRAAIVALEGDVGVAEIAERYRSRRELVTDQLRRSEHLRIRGSEGAMYVMLDIGSVERDCEAFAWRLLEEENVAVMPGVSFGEAARSHIRITLAQPEAVLRRGVETLIAFAARYQAQR